MRAQRGRKRKRDADRSCVQRASRSSACSAGSRRRPAVVRRCTGVEDHRWGGTWRGGAGTHVWPVLLNANASGGEVESESWQAYCFLCHEFGGMGSYKLNACESRALASTEGQNSCHKRRWAGSATTPMHSGSNRGGCLFCKAAGPLPYMHACTSCRSRRNELTGATSSHAPARMQSPVGAAALPPPDPAAPHKTTTLAQRCGCAPVA